MIEFIFSHPIILVILIGVISSIVKKKNKPIQKKQGQAPKSTWQEIIGEIQKAWMGEKEKTSKPLKKKNVLPAQTIEIDEETEQKRIAELKRLQQEYDLKQGGESEPHNLPDFPVPSAAKYSKSSKVISDEGSPVYHKDLSFRKQNLINGIIMSEVLGPPRAKKSIRESRQ